MVVGDHTWAKMSLKWLGIPLPDAPDYPDCLKHLLHRKIWLTTLGDLLDREDKNYFIKPAEDIKAFSGFVESKDMMMKYLIESFPLHFPVLCSELIDMISEYRVYCIDGAIKGIA